MNNKLKKMLSLIKICAIIGVIMIVLFCIPWIVLFWELKFSKEPATPVQTNGEFPYKLVYELDGQTYTKEGKFVCKYEGISMNEGRGKYRVWIGFVEGTNETSVLLFEDETIKIYCYIGDAEYYMGDAKYSGHNSDVSVMPHLFCKPKKEDDMKLLSESEITSIYKIKIIEWEFSEPITNSFN